MQEESKIKIQELLNEWRATRSYIYEFKQVLSGKSHINDGEFVLQLTNTLKGFYYNGKELEISKISKPFHTTSLSNNPLSNNVNADYERLKQLIKEFDDEFYPLIDEKLAECGEVILTSDPTFF
jgi:hypothetical protein